MIDTRQNVFNPKNDVSSGDLKAAWHRLHIERGPRRDNSGHLRGAVEAFNTHEHVGQGGGETRVECQGGPAGSTVRLAEQSREAVQK
jgi:hypothetical protein